MTTAREGMLCIGQNPATSPQRTLDGAACQARVRWSRTTGSRRARRSGSRRRGEERQVKPADIRRGLLLSVGAGREYDGSFTNTQRMLQWHYKAAEPRATAARISGSLTSWQTPEEALRPNIHGARDAGSSLTWDFDPGSSEPRDPGRCRRRRLSRRPQDPEGDQRLLHRRGGRAKHLAASATSRTTARRPARRGSTAACSRAGQNARPAQGDPPGTPARALGWAWAWPANRRIMYNRASADPNGRPWSERKKWCGGTRRREVGRLDVPDFAATSRRRRPGLTRSASTRSRAPIRSS